MNNLNTIYQIKITDLIEKYKNKNDKSLTHLYSKELFNFVTETTTNSFTSNIILANFYSNTAFNTTFSSESLTTLSTWPHSTMPLNMEFLDPFNSSMKKIIHSTIPFDMELFTWLNSPMKKNIFSTMPSNTKSLPFKNFRDLLRYINVLFFNEIKKKLRSDRKKTKLTTIKFNDLDETPNKFWKSKVKDYISEVEFSLKKILESKVDDQSNFKITIIFSSDFANLLKIKNKSKNKFDNLLKKYNIQTVEHDFLNKLNEFTVNHSNQGYWKNKKINSNLEKDTILLVITKKEDDFRFQINNQIEFLQYKDSLIFDNHVVVTKTNFNKIKVNLSKADIFAIQSKIKRTRHYIKYCLEKNDCYGANGCFHFLEKDPELKNKILIYGPNGSGKSSLIKELSSQSAISENLNNQEIMVFDDNFIHKHIYQKGMNSENQTELSHHFTSDRGKSLSKILKFYTDDLIKLRNKKKEYETQIQQLKNDWKKWDTQLFEWFFEIISGGHNKELKEIKKFFLTDWKKYWIDNNNLLKNNYSQKDYDGLKKFWNLSFNKIKKQISNHFVIEKSFSESIKIDFTNKEAMFFIFLKQQQSQIQKNSQNIKNEIDNYQKTFENFDHDKNIFRITGQNWNLKKIHGETINKIKKIVKKAKQTKIEIPGSKNEINNINDLLYELKINFQTDHFNSDELLDFNKKIDNSLNNFFNKYVDKIKLKVKKNGRNLIEKIFEKNDSNKIIIEFKSTLKDFKKNVLKEIIRLQNEINYEVKALEEELEVELDAIQNKWNFPTKIKLKYSDKTKDNKNTKNDKNSEETEDYSVKITGQNGKGVIEYLSIGELKSLAIVIFFLYLKRKFFKNKKKSSNKKYLIIFDDVYDGLDFAATFRFNASLKWLLDYFDKNLKYRPKMMFLTHQFDFINFFHNQYKKKDEKFDFFRLFKENETSKSKHTFVKLNLNELIKTNLMVFRKYLDKMIDQFEKHNQHKKQDLLHNLINQVIFWSISRLTLETILTNKINLQNEKVVLNRNSNAIFKKYLEKLFNKSKGERKTKEEILKILRSSQDKFWQKESEKEKKFSQKYNLKERILKILKILQENILKENLSNILDKWKPHNETFVFLSQKNNENKICNISPKNLFLMTKTFKDFLFEIKIINQTKNKEIDKKLECFSNKYKEYNDIIAKTEPEFGPNTTIELKELEDYLKKILKKLLDTKKIEEIKKEDLYIEKMIKKIFSTKEITKKDSHIKEMIKKIFSTKEITKKDLYIEKMIKEIFSIKEIIKKNLYIKETIKEIFSIKEIAKKDLYIKEIIKKNLCTKKITKVVLRSKEITKEDLYIKYVLLQRAIFFLKEGYKEACVKKNNKKNNIQLQGYDSSLFTFLRHANNNFFPSLLMFDASFEKLLESEEQNKSIITQKITKN